MRYIGKSIIGAFDNKGYYLQKSAIALIPKKEDIDLRFILAIINSNLMNWYYIKAQKFHSTMPANPTR